MVKFATDFAMVFGTCNVPDFFVFTWYYALSLGCGETLLAVWRVGTITRDVTPKLTWRYGLSVRLGEVASEHVCRQFPMLLLWYLLVVLLPLGQQEFAAATVKIWRRQIESFHRLFSILLLYKDSQGCSLPRWYALWFASSIYVAWLIDDRL